MGVPKKNCGTGKKENLPGFKGLGGVGGPAQWRRGRCWYMICLGFAIGRKQWSRHGYQSPKIAAHCRLPVDRLRSPDIKTEDDLDPGISAQKPR